MGSLIGWVIAALGFSVIVGVGAIWSGYVLVVVWGWFIVPMFGLFSLTLPQAIGLSLITGYLTHQYQREVKTSSKVTAEDWMEFRNCMIHVFVRPLMVLAIGWIVKQWL